MPHLKPRTRTPELSVQTVNGGSWQLSEQSPENFTLIVAYRGLHCPICKTYLRDLNRQVDEFQSRGVEVLAVSSDSKERAETANSDWGLDRLVVGYGMTIPSAREWGLYISTGIGKSSLGVEEPNEFSEPGMFFIRPDQTLYAASISTMPFARPHFSEVLAAVDIIIKKNYPARGEA